jgi:hypothetical protein
MKNLPSLVRSLLAVLAGSFAGGLPAATFTVTPNVVSNDYAGRITFHMSGLPPGETVQVVQYYDFNGNGVVDAGDIAVRGESVADGQFKLLDGATNINVFRDEDGATNGAITAAYWFPLSPFGGAAVGSYVFRMSSPSNHFAPTNLQFTVASPPYAQAVHGVVSDFFNFTNIPNAVVALIRAKAGINPTFVVGATADAGGNYTLKAPPGQYQAVAFQAGFVGNLLTFPQITLTSNANIAADLPLMAASTSLGGALRDSLNPAQPAVPYAELAVSTTNGFVTIGACDGNANFNLPVIPGLWRVAALSQSAMAQGYMLSDGGRNPQYDTSGGPVTNVVVLLNRATALINGRVVDSAGNAIPDVKLYANADFGQYNAFATSVSNGWYTLAIDAGIGTVNVADPNEAPASNYLWPTPQFGINDGEALDFDLVGWAATARFRAHVIDDTGAPVTNLEAGVDSYAQYGAYSLATTDTNGDLDMPVFGGEWDFEWISDLPSNLVFPDVPPFFITDGVNLTNDMVARRVTGAISGYVRDGNGQGLTNFTIIVTNHIGATSFTLRATTDAGGNYAVSVFDGIWNVGLDNNALDFLGYVTPVAATNVTVPPAGGIANFVVSSVPPPQILTTSLPDGTISNYYSAGLDETNGAYPTFWSLVSGALPGGLTLNQFGYIFGTPTNLGLFNFSLKVQDNRGSNEVQALSIRIDPPLTGPPQILTPALVVAAQGCPYANQILATNGTPPYSWSLAAGSDPLPPGMQLATNGVLSGTPLTNGYYSLLLEVAGADGESTNSPLQLQVNDPLQYYPYPLSAGSVGASYFGALSVYGGAQPQTWSVTAGSLPAGVTLDPATGYITGTPGTTGIYPFSLRVTDGCTTFDVATVITNYPALQITTTALPVAAPNLPFTAQVQAAGGAPPYAWYAYPAPAFGLTLNQDGSITGTAYAEGVNNFNVVVYDAIGDSATTNLTLVVSSQALLDVPAFAGANQFTFRVTGVAGKDYILQSSLDLSNWVDLLTTNAPMDIFYLGDTNVSDPARFYRLEEGP